MDTACTAAKIGILAGAVAVHPVVGLATFLSFASSDDDGLLAESLRDRADKRREVAAYGRGLKKVLRAKPVLRVNPLLTRLDNAVSGRLADPGGEELRVRDYDPVSNVFAEEGQTYRDLTVNAIHFVFRDDEARARLDPRVRAWVENVS